MRRIEVLERQRGGKAGRRRRQRALLAAAAIAAVLGALAAASPALASPGDVIVGDSDAGKVIRLDPETGEKSTISADPALVAPSDSVFGPRGELYVVDWDAFAGLKGGVFRIDPRTGKTTELSSGALFEDPDGIARGPSGDLLVTDVNAEPAAFDGALLRVSAAGGPPRLVSSTADGVALRTPVGVVVPPDGRPIVSTFAPSIVRVDPRTGAQTVIADASDGLDGGAGLVRAPDGTLYFNGGTELLAVDPTTGKVRPVVPNIALGEYGMAIDFAGNVIAADISMNIVRMNPRTGAVETIGTGFEYPEGFEVEPPRCLARMATIVGSTRADRLGGSRLADVIHALGANDRIAGRRGNDRICAGAGNDRVRDTKGRNRIDCGPGRDVAIINRRSKTTGCERVRRR